MPQKPVFASLTRISDLAVCPFGQTILAHSEWQTGDYVVGEVLSEWNRSSPIELPGGRMTEVLRGDLVVGALGVRAATLEAAGHWNAVGPDLKMHAMTGAGLFGRATSISPFISRLVELVYRGHVTRAGQPVRMTDFVPTLPPAAYDRPTILLIGTSMSSGKTTSARVIIRQLAEDGLRIMGVKFTGAGRQRDILAMLDSGADEVMDFVDVGLPSTVCDPAAYQASLATLLTMIQQAAPDVVVAEAGASPVEPYNGDALMQTIRDTIRYTVLCASDPYAVIGVQQGFGFEPDLISGVATSTSAGVDVIRDLTGLEALNLLDASTHPQLRARLLAALSS